MNIEYSWHYNHIKNETVVYFYFKNEKERNDFERTNPKVFWAELKFSNNTQEAYTGFMTIRLAARDKVTWKQMGLLNLMVKILFGLYYIIK